METKKILIWGEAGVGKTTFCSKFCLDWALVVTEMEGKGHKLTEDQKSELEKLTEEQRSKLNKIGLLFYIVLRDIGSKTVKDIIISKLGLNKLNDSQLSSILENVSECRKFVLLMDGFDEISDKDEHVQEVLNGPTYHNVHSVTTCRPHATGGIVLNVDVEIRLKGFSEAQAKAFVEMYAKVKYNEYKQIVLFVEKTMSQIESSAELLEMSTNPSMLQLLCLLSFNNGKIGKNRTSVFKDYTSYLLMQFHKKQCKKEDFYSEKTLYDSYHKNLLDAGKVALMGLKQNQLQLVFSKSDALDACKNKEDGKAIFDIGFFTELPSSDTDSVKVQFTHKTLQEYLAAFYVVNTPGDEGLQLLMEFCSTSQRLMGSQIILEFVSNMSTDILKREMQKTIKDFVSKWDSDDKVDPKSRTSFLISMLEGTETLQFPLPAVIDVDFTYTSYKNSALKRFFDMNGQGVRKISLTLDEDSRLNVLQNTKIHSLDELNIAIASSQTKVWSKEDNDDLHRVMLKMKPGLLSVTNCEWKSIDKATIAVILQHVHTLILEKCSLKKEHLLSIHESVKSLSLCNCGIQIDTEIAEAVSRLPDLTQLDLSGNQVTDKSACITLIHKAATMKSLSICNCGIQIDTEIAEAVSRLPGHTQLDLSGNQVTDNSACVALIHTSANMKSLYLCNCGIQINRLIAESVSRLPDDIQLDLSGNKLTKMDPRLLPGVLLHMPQDKEINMTECEITIDVDIVKALSKMPQLKSLKASRNKLTPEAAREFSLSQLQQLELCKCGINDNVCVPLMISLSEYCPKLRVLKLGNEMFQNNNNTLTSDKWCDHVQMKQLRELDLSYCGINDTVCVSLMISLSKHCPLLEVLHLGGNNLTSDVWCHHVQMKHLGELYLYNCGINDTACVSLMISLSKHCPMLEVLHLYGNNLSSSGLQQIVHHIKHMMKLKTLWLHYNPCMEDKEILHQVEKALQTSNPTLTISKVL